MSGCLSAEATINATNPCFSSLYPNTNAQEQSPLLHYARVHESSRSSLGTSHCIEVPPPYTEPNCVTTKQDTDSSSMASEVETGDRVACVMAHMERKRRDRGFKLAREVKCRKLKRSDNDGMSKNTQERKLKANKKEKKTVCQEIPTGYVHVRARRGQATDSHSLAERVRREKISERMRILQSIVPGCDKITGKALILDEIINYVQSLQNQVEFLVAKLYSLYPMFNDFEVDLDTNALLLEKGCSLEIPMPSLLHSDDNYHSIQFRSVPETTPTSASLLLQQGPESNVFFQNEGNLSWDVENQTKKLTNRYGFDDLYSV